MTAIWLSIKSIHPQGLHLTVRATILTAENTQQLEDEKNVHFSNTKIAPSIAMHVNVTQIAVPP